MVASSFHCVLAFAFIVTATEARFGCQQQNQIIVNSYTGTNSPECLKENSSSPTPCETLGYALSNSSSLNCREIVLEGHQWIHDTLTVSSVDHLTIQGSGYTVDSGGTGSGIVFKSVSNLKVLNITFNGCGTLLRGTNPASIKHYSAVHVINSMNVQFIKVSFHGSVGRGLSITNVQGEVNVSGGHFIENTLPAVSKETAKLEGGGMYIKFSSCSSNCDKGGSNKYLIKDCLFHSNRATNYSEFRIMQGTNMGRGGGIIIVITSYNTSIIIHNSAFYNNSAQYGGGIYAVLHGTAHNNTISIQSCNFTDNHAGGGGGVALQMGYGMVEEMTHNIITLHNSTFVYNSALLGGALGVLSTRLNSETTHNKLELAQCTWVGNFAAVGAAISLASFRGSKFIGVFPIAVIRACTFTRNKLVARSSTENIILERGSISGVIDVKLFEFYISEHISFEQNSGSPITATATGIHIMQNTVASFVSNTAVYGGGITLLIRSVLFLYPGSKLFFESNHASEFGGAIYSLYPSLNAFIYSERCFISHHSENYSDQRQPLVSFTNNTARYGYSIYTEPLHHCLGQIRGIGTDTFEWKGLQFLPDFKEHTITTGPATINFTLPPEIAPGERIDLKLSSLDELKQPIPAAYSVTITVSGEGEARTNPYIAKNVSLQIWGKPGTVFNLTLQTQNQRAVSATNTSQLGNCPLGFTLVGGDECVCSASTDDKGLVGVEECDTSSFKAYIQTGYWLGCTPSGEVITSYCPLEYCNYHITSSHHARGVPRSCDLLEESSVLCVEHRRGGACGECEDGYSVFFHSEHFGCGPCPYGALGLLLYVVSELVPLLLFFAVIMMTRFKMTSGLMQSLLLFNQTVSFINLTPSLIPNSNASRTLIHIHTFLLGFLNLEFFKLNEISFCLWSGATVLNNLAFRYVTTVFAMLFLALYIFLVKNHLLVDGGCKFCTNIAKRLKFHKKAIIHSISTVLILSYTQYTLTSLQILAHVPVYGEGKLQIGSIVRLQGSVEHFGREHLPYAIPALLVLVFLSLPPPLLLISYPLLWNTRAKLTQSLGGYGDNTSTPWLIRKLKQIVGGNGDNTTTPWLIRKLLPLIDSFQGVFKDNCRMFAGLLFLWRIILATIFACSPTHTLFFFLTEVALIVIFTLHVLARPYKRRLYNVIDTAMLANMALINLLSWHISIGSLDSEEGLDYLDAEIAIKLLLMYAPIIVLVIFAVIWALRKLRVIPEDLRWLRTHEEPVRLSSSRTKREGAYADEDLFSRAAEQNTSSYIMTSGEMGFELKERNSTENTCATKGMIKTTE